MWFFPMKKTLIRALSFCMILALLTGLMAPFASAIDYEGVEPITLDSMSSTSRTPMGSATPPASPRS